MSYHGIPVAALYDNPYANFGFVHTCMDKASYFALLRGEERAKVDFDRDEICSFYYQAFLERFETVDRTPFDLLESFNGDTYSGRYLEFILSHADEIFTDRFVDAYERALT